MIASAREALPVFRPILPRHSLLQHLNAPLLATGQGRSGLCRWGATLQESEGADDLEQIERHMLKRIGPVVAARVGALRLAGRPISGPGKPGARLSWGRSNAVEDLFWLANRLNPPSRR